MARLTRQDIVAGYWDRLIDSLSGRTAQRIDSTDRRYMETVDSIREELRQRGMGGTRILDDVADAARNARNAGKTQERRWESDPSATVRRTDRVHGRGRDARPGHGRDEPVPRGGVQHHGADATTGRRARGRGGTV